MPTLFKRYNGIYYSILTDQSGRRKWQSTGQRTKRLALRNLSSTPQELPPIEPQKTLQEFRGEFMEYARQMHTPGNVGVYARAFPSFQEIVGDVEPSSTVGDVRHSISLTLAYSARPRECDEYGISTGPSLDIGGGLVYSSIMFPMAGSLLLG
jgi:hypothetical protein